MFTGIHCFKDTEIQVHMKTEVQTTHGYRDIEIQRILCVNRDIQNIHTDNTDTEIEKA